MTIISNIARLFTTIYYLKFSQVFWRVAHKFRWQNRQNVFGKTICVRIPTNAYVADRSSSSTISEDITFNFLNQKEKLTDIGWNNINISLLWRYYQHYFDDLNSVDALGKVRLHYELLDDWCEKNFVGQSVGWDPYPTSLRIVNWIKWHLTTAELKKAHLKNLYTQTSYLYKNLERHLLGNHIFANAKALVYAGLFFRNNDGKRWYEKGLSILKREIAEQILPDGGHFEKSPMYHAIILNDLLDLYNLAATYNDGELRDLVNPHIQRMFYWLEKLSHPDGDIAFFNDSCFGNSKALKSLLEYAKNIGIQVSVGDDNQLTILKDTGYVRLENPNYTIISNMGGITANYIPGHTHADVLSLEVSILGKRIIVNSGTSTYDKSPLRDFQRSTAAHSTVIVDGKNSSDTWSSFRVGRRASVGNIQYEYQETTSCLVECSHTGFSSLFCKVTHRRTIQLESDKLTIIDRVGGRRFKDVEINFYLHPSCTINLIDEFNADVFIDQKKVARVSSRVIPMIIVRSTYFPKFGVEQQNYCIRLMKNGDKSIISTVKFELEHK